MPSLTVVVPALDDAEALRECLAALARQTQPPEEVIVVDNGSTDDTALVAESAGARVLREPRRGIAIAAATGFDAATGELLARLDADSVPADDWAERLRDLLDSRLAAATGPASFYGGSAARRWVGKRLYLPFYFRVVGAALGHPPVFGSNFGMTREVWERVGRHVHRTPDVHDDFDLSFLLTPPIRVRYERGLEVRISARQLTAGSFARHVVRAITTIARNLRRPRRRAG